MKEPTLRRGRAVAWLPLVMTLLWGAGATQVEAQRVHRHSSSVEGYFIADFLGEYRLRVDGERRASGDLDLDTTFGGGLRVGMTSGVFAMGLMAEFRGYGNARYEDRDFAFDLAPYLGFRIPLIESRGNKVRLRGTFPLGFTVLRPAENAYGDSRYVGFNAGALGGMEVVFGPFGFFIDVGLRYHRVYANEDLGPLGDVKANLSWTQLSLNAGMHYEF
ncbi:MAG: hypothetical protein KBB95_22130 [Deltaproteobacteria bacterium]|nr:hypothetical protein [Deltaproteobacteria bacterium]